MKKIELNVEEVKNRVLPCNLSVTLLPDQILAITRNLNEVIDKKQSESSQVEWFKLSEKRPMSGHTVLWIEENWHRPTMVRYVDDLANDRAHKIYWTPCPTPPEFDSPCVRELKEYFKANGATQQSSGIVAGAIEIVKQHEKKEKE